MTGMDTNTNATDTPRVRVTVEVDADVVDLDALMAAAVAAGPLHDDMPDVPTSPADAVMRAMHASAVVEGVPGLDSRGATFGADDVDRFGMAAGPPRPDFATLFATCGCGNEDCGTCTDWRLTPRTAYALWGAAVVLSDEAYSDVVEHGDDPVDPDSGAWRVFDEYPAYTHRQDAVWRRQAARSFDDLAGDLAAGRVPEPRCFGEEMALSLVVQRAEDDTRKGGDDIGLPVLGDDHDWDNVHDVLLDDADVTMWNDPEWDGIEDPDSDENRLMGIGDMRAHAWFRPFGHVEPRDPRRPFRR